MTGHYSLSRARTSLVYFGAGKAVSAVTGLAVLLLTVRSAPATAFGAYVTLMAIVEIFYLVSGLGLSYFAQRYVPELRIRAGATQFAAELRRIQVQRAALAIGVGVPLCLAASIWSPWLHVPVAGELVLYFGVALIAGACMRFLDELFQALLLQGWGQLQSVVRNVGRLAALSIVLAMAGAVDLRVLLAIEALVALAATVTGVAMLEAYLRRQQPVTTDPLWIHALPDARRQALRFYCAQVLAQTYGPNAVKLVVATTLGVQGTAILGFAHSCVDILRSYSPAFLLSGWVRPLMVSRFVENGNVAALRPLTRLVAGLSLVGLLPFAVVFVVFGDEFTALVGAGRYPQAAVLLAPLVVVVALQAVHVVLGMLCATLERTSFVLAATIVCAVTLPLAWVLTRFYGVSGTVLALIVSESLWIATVLVLLQRRLHASGFIDAGGLGRAILAATAVGAAAYWAQSQWPMTSPIEWFAACLVLFAGYFALVWVGRVFGPDERALVGKLRNRGDSTARPEGTVAALPSGPVA